MPNTREKLIDILAGCDCNTEYCDDCEFANDIDGCVRRQKEIIADHLIANGVTIPVRCGECREFVCRNDVFEQHCRLYGASVDSNDFCSCGERRNDG